LIGWQIDTDSSSSSSSSSSSTDTSHNCECNTNNDNNDCDGDGVRNGDERSDGTNPFDGCSYIPQNQTVTVSTKWENLDCDNDLVTNGIEMDQGSNPKRPDSDNDGVDDGTEYHIDNTDMNDKCSYVASSQGRLETWSGC